MLTQSAVVAPRCSAAAPRSRTRCSASAPEPQSRRAALAAGLAALAALAAPRAARAYGGSGNIRSTDEGSGNPRYEDLVATLKERGALVSKIDTSGGVPPPKSKCLTGREEACK
jgi:hypothetical protein